MKKTFLGILTLVLGLQGISEAAVIYLRDQTTVSGTIVSATARDVQVSTPQGLMTITTDRIARIDYSDTGVAAPTPVQTGRRQWFSLGMGFNIPLSQVDFGSVGGGRDDNGDVGFLLSPQYLYGVNSRLGVGANFEFADRSRTQTQNLLPFSNTEVHGTNILLLGIAKYSLVDHGPVRPYLMGGLGAHHSSTHIDAQPNIGFAWSDTNTDEPRSIIDDSHWGLASTLRVGVDFSWVSPTVFGMEFGWTHMSSETFGPTPAGKDLGLAPVSGVQNRLDIVFRWGWRF